MVVVLSHGRSRRADGSAERGQAHTSAAVVEIRCRRSLAGEAALSLDNFASEHKRNRVPFPPPIRPERQDRNNGVVDCSASHRLRREMTMLNSGPRCEIRFDWFEANVRECQSFAGRTLVMRGSSEVEGLADALALALADPENAAEDLLLHGLLLGVAAKWATWVHNSAHGTVEPSCRFVPERTLDRFWADARGAKNGFTEWSRAFAAEFARLHPRSAAQQAAHLIRRDYRRHWDTEQLACALGSKTALLRRAFMCEHGITPVEYLRQVRLIHALERLAASSEKIEPISVEVGYGSKKNFYHAFRTLTGTTPGAFRRLPADEARRLIDAVKAAARPADGHRARLS
jgi:AraC-like DNA-binding protein